MAKVCKCLDVDSMLQEICVYMKILNILIWNHFFY